MASPRSELPTSVQRALWDVRVEDLSWDLHRAFIIERVLAHGDWDAIRWIRARVGDATLREVLLSTRGRLLDPPQLRFWELVLGLPADVVDAWLRAPARALWDRRSA